MSELDAKIEIKIADNKMRVTANYFPARGTGEDLASDSVHTQLEDMNVRIGIKLDTIKTVCTSDKPMRNIIVAEGLPPQVGEKAKIETYFELNDRRQAAEKDDGSVDFRDLGEISSTQEGQELYRRVPPTIGAPGKDIYGNEIPGLPGRDLKLVLGKGTRLDEDDENLIRAANDGEILVAKGVVTISSVHQVDGDIDYSTGNLIFNGTVKINGNVKSGFKVTAEGDIEINGNVEDAEVDGGNDIIINGGFTGTGEGVVRARRDVILKFIENQRIEADRDIIISGASYHANLESGRSILSQGPKSMIVGGCAQAKSTIEGNRFGSDAGSVTILKVGLDPKLALRMQELDEQAASTQSSLEKVEKTVLFLYRTKIDNNNSLPADKQQLLEKLEATKKSLPEKLKLIEKKKKQLATEQRELEDAYVKANVSVFTKVKVYFAQQFINVDDKVGPSVFRMFKSEIIRSSK